MTYVTTLPSPVGKLTLSSDGQALTGLWLEGQKYFCAGLPTDVKEKDLPVFRQAEAYLTAYFSGASLPPLPPLAPAGTDFQRSVWALLTEIPWGRTRTYGEQPHLHPDPLSPRGGGRRQPHRLRRRRGAQALSAGAGGGGPVRSPGKGRRGRGRRLDLPSCQPLPQRPPKSFERRLRR